jgi:hypothetical protein
MNTNSYAMQRQCKLTQQLVEAFAAKDYEWAERIAQILRHEYRDWNPPPLARGWRLGE